MRLQIKQNKIDQKNDNPVNVNEQENGCQRDFRNLKD